jgi:hypothetical protein
VERRQAFDTPPSRHPSEAHRAQSKDRGNVMSTHAIEGFLEKTPESSAAEKL